MAYICAFLSFLLLTVISLLEWRGLHIADEAEKLSGIAIHSNATLDRITELKAATSAANLALLNKAEHFERLFWTYRRLATQESSASVQLSHYCQALSALGNAIYFEKQNAPLLAYWADLRSVLGSYDCQLPFTTANEPSQVIPYALEQQPMSMNVAFVAGVSYLHNGQKQKALEQFGRVVLYSTNINSLRRKTIFESIENQTDLQTVVPALYPQTLDWARLYSREAPELRWGKWTQTFDDMLFASLRELKQRAHNDAMPPSELFLRLKRYTDVFSSDEMRRFLDRSLSETAQAQLARFNNPALVRLADYLKLRSELRRLNTISAITLEDTRPESSSLYLFGFSKPVQFRQFPHSLGLYFPDGENVVASIELRSQQPIDLNRIRVLSSVDNLRYKDKSREFIWQEIEQQSERIYSGFLTSPQEISFLKVSLERDVRDRPLSIEMSSGVSAYGPTLQQNMSDSRMR